MSVNNEKFVEIAIQLALSVGAFLLVLIAGLAIRAFLFRYLMQWAQKTKHDLDDIIISAVKGPFVIWFIMLGIYAALQFHNLPAKLVDDAGKILLALGLFSVTLVAANIASGLITHYSARMGSTLPGGTLIRTIVRIVIFAVGILIILNVLGLSISPILATLGVGGLAVALALQDTLSNLFAGFHIITNQIVRVGDYIKLESGEEGYVVDVNWRTTKVKMFDNNTILIPNSKLTQTNVTNFYLPEKDLAIFVKVGVHYNSDLEFVEKVTCEVAKEVMREVKGGVPDYDPFIRYDTFGDSSIGFTAVLRAREYMDRYLVIHEFIKRLHRRYSKEGIVLPYPIRAINYSQEKAP